MDIREPALQLLDLKDVMTSLTHWVHHLAGVNLLWWNVFVMNNYSFLLILLIHMWLICKSIKVLYHISYFKLLQIYLGNNRSYSSKTIW